VPLLDLVPRSFGDYEAAGGGRGLQTALGAWPVAVIQEVAGSGLRGRGGAGFPTGDKWQAVRSVGAGPRSAVGNAAEGEPATFKDRLLLRTNPYQVLAIATYAVGAERAYVGLKETFTAELQALTRALGEMREADALGPVPVELVLGPDLYLFGEETGLEEVIEGRPPLPRVARPFIQGLFARPPAENPTLVNNVETLANVPHILADGPDWLRATGTQGARARWSSRSAVLAVPVPGVVRAVPGLQVRDRRGHRDAAGARGGSRIRPGPGAHPGPGEGSTGGQKCALPTGESLLMQSLVQAFREEFGSHVGRSCPLPRALPFHKLIDWDATAGRFTYDLAYADKQPDWTYSP
jgi:NADH:ubiquinone oxidoreductase subunit F (NADH-binding)